MSKKAKIKEAEYFLARMKEEHDNRESFDFNLSAFLSAARSVLQYAGKEAKAKKGGQQWHDNWISASPILKFFKCKRNINIHDEPVKPSAHFHDTITDTVYISGSISIVHKDKDGKIISEYSSEPPKVKPKKPETSIEQKVMYKLSDWTGDEDVLTLCKKYIQELEKVVKNGMSKEFITG